MPWRSVTARSPSPAERQSLCGSVGARERARGAGPAPVADLSPLVVRGVAAPPLVRRAVAPVEDHLDVRVVLVVVRHPLEEFALQLARDHAVDHAPSRPVFGGLRQALCSPSCQRRPLWSACDASASTRSSPCRRGAPCARRTGRRATSSPSTRACSRFGPDACREAGFPGISLNC